MTTDQPRHWSFYRKLVRALMPVLGSLMAALFAFWIYPRISDKFFPATNYYVLADVVVLENVVLENYKILATRVIKQPFDGAYDTTVRRLDESRPICSGGKKLRYQPRTDGDYGLETVEYDFSEWTSGAEPPCLDAIRKDYAENGPSSYTLTSCIQVEEGLVIHMKSVCAVTVFAWPPYPIDPT